MMIRVSGGRMAVPSPNGIETGISLYHLFPHTCMGMTTDAGMFFEETNRTPFCPDLSLHGGDPFCLSTLGRKTRHRIDSLRTPHPSQENEQGRQSNEKIRAPNLKDARIGYAGSPSWTHIELSLPYSHLKGTPGIAFFQ